MENISLYSVDFKFNQMIEEVTLLFMMFLLNSRHLMQRLKQTIVSARFGGPTEAIKRLLCQLPVSAQSFTSSPYLDFALFSYDEKRVSMMERPKCCGEHPIR
jgi:de-etiolated-1